MNRDPLAEATALAVQAVLHKSPDKDQKVARVRLILNGMMALRVDGHFAGRPN